MVPRLVPEILSQYAFCDGGGGGGGAAAGIGDSRSLIIPHMDMLLTFSLFSPSLSFRCNFQLHLFPPMLPFLLFPIFSDCTTCAGIRSKLVVVSWPRRGGEWEKVNGKCHVSQASWRHTPNSALIGFFLADSHYQD